MEKLGFEADFYDSASGCTKLTLELEETADFALAFWMLHEVPDQTAFLAEVCACLRPGGHLLIAEPRVHVGSAAFERSVAIAQRVGLLPVARPAVAMSRAVLVSK